MNPASQYKTRVVTTTTEIDQLRDFWNSCDPCRDADLDFYLSIVKLCPETVRPHVVVLYDCEVPKALLVGRLDLTRIPIKIGYATMPVPNMRILQIVYGGCLGEVSGANAKLLVGSIMDSLAAGEADAAAFQHVAFNSALAQFAVSIPSWFCSDHLVRPEFHRVRDSFTQSGTLFTGFSGNERYQQRKRALKLANDFKSVTIELCTSPDDVPCLIRDAESVAKKSYQRGLGVGFFETSVIRARLEFEARKGWLRAYVLHLDSRPCAFWIGSLRNKVFLSDYLAFDSEYAKYAPGMYLMIKVIEELCCDLGAGSSLAERIDFGIGDAPYKERLSNREYQEASVYIFAPKSRAIWVNALRSAVGLASRFVKWLMRTTALFAIVKRIWRVRVTPSG
jgi:hypothetical protein